jgi:hypothetical protein
MDAQSFLILAVGLIASLTVFLLMRFPNLRRAQFRQQRAYPIRMAALCAAVMLGFFAQ